jgi:hypothetical protein
MASFFEQALLRLKEQLQLQADKEVASVLGLSPTAFNDRKKRDAFPEDKLLALSVKRPELKLDVTYILTGERVSDRDRDALERTADVVAKMEPAGDGPISKKMLQAYKRTGPQQKVRRNKYDDLETMLDRCTDDDLAMVMSLAMRLALKEIVK